VLWKLGHLVPAVSVFVLKAGEGMSKKGARVSKKRAGGPRSCNPESGLLRGSGGVCRDRVAVIMEGEGGTCGVFGELWWNVYTSRRLRVVWRGRSGKLP